MESKVGVKAYAFAIKVVNTYKVLTDLKKEFVLSKQLLRSGTSIGALIREANQGESKADFLHKMNIALKEANETFYWIELLNDTSFLTDEAFQILHKDCDEIISMLVSIIKTTKKTLGK